MTLPDYLKQVRARLEKSGYTVSDFGLVESFQSNWRGYGPRPMKQDLNSHGYPRVRLVIEGKRKTFLVHKLVAEIFIGPRPSPSHEVCHRNGVKTDNRVSNLYWGTRKDNAADRTKHGNCKAAENGRRSAWKLKGRKKQSNRICSKSKTA